MDGRAVILRGAPGLHSASPETLLALGERFTVRWIRDRWLCHEGDPSKEMYLLAEGHLGVYRQQKRVTLLGPGVFVGHVGALSGAPRSAGLRASGSVVLLVMDAGQVRAIVRSEAGAAASALRRALIVAYGRQIQEATQALVRLASDQPADIADALLAAAPRP
ncbi:MAG: cyclic nucleotide-binding domain-containing protein [Myxococcota bacterium]